MDKYNARSTFDYLNAEFRGRGPGKGQASDTNEQGGLAWTQAYWLQAYMLMYETYKDRQYLDFLVGNVEQILANRDSVRGVTDYRGLSLPAWRALDPYTVARATLAGSAGNPLLEVRTSVAGSNEATALASVSAGSVPATFTLTVKNTALRRSETFPDLSLDPASPNYAVTRIYRQFPALYPGSSMQLTSFDLRTSRAADDIPTWGTQGMTPLPLIVGVHTGTICYPIAKFVRTVLTTPALQARYGAIATFFLHAVTEAVAVHEDEFFELPDASGAYRWAKGAPIVFDGCEYPLNMKDALGSTYLELAVAAREQEYLKRALQLAQSTKTQFHPDADGATIWTYHPTYSSIYTGFKKTGSSTTDRSLHTPSYGGLGRYEDVGHGALSVEFAAMAHMYGLAFTDADIAGLVATIKQNILTQVVGKYTAYPNVDGGGTRGLAFQLASSGLWLRLSKQDGSILTPIHTLYRHNNLTNSALGIAYLNWATLRSSPIRHR